MTSRLVARLGQRTYRPFSAGIQTLCSKILDRHGPASAAILYYGSCFRSRNEAEGIVDLYLVVDSYRAVYDRALKSALNRLLPPNVFYLEVPFEGSIVRAKYAVISMADLKRCTSKRCFHSYFWARFAQPTGLAYVRDAQAEAQVKGALAQAIMTFVIRAIPEVKPPFSARHLWQTGLKLSYGAELRTENLDKGANLFDADPQYYDEITALAMEGVPFEIEALKNCDPVRYEASIPGRVHGVSRMAWRVRHCQGKVLSLLRLLKGLFTFEGGVDYILWKIARHSGVSVEMGSGLRRCPVLGICLLAWRLYRRGGFR